MDYRTRETGNYGVGLEKQVIMDYRTREQVIMEYRTREQVIMDYRTREYVL